MMLISIIVIIIILVNYLIYKNTVKSQIMILSKLEFYEQKLLEIEVKINLFELNQNHENKEQVKDNELHEKQTKPQDIIDLNGINNYTSTQILKLLNDKSLTSRDIQKSINKTREHVARVMKKLYENGYVVRNTNTRPFNYSITKKGKQVFMNS